MSKQRSKTLESHIEGLEELVKYFSSRNKEGREQWVVRSFLRNAGVPFQDVEIESSQSDPPDVIFRDAKFEIKEILDPDRRRHEEFKAELEKAKAATSMRGMHSMFTPVDVSLNDIYARCLVEVQKLSNKYPSAVRKQLDLLFYVNLQHVMEIVEHPFPETSAIKTHCWRSVSFVKGNRACCFHAYPSAPSFIQAALGKVIHRDFE